MTRAVDLPPLPPITAAEVAAILAHVPSRPGYHEWLEVIFAVGGILNSDESAAVLAAWSPEEKTGEYHQKLRSICKRSPGALINIAKAHGFDASAFAKRRAARARETNTPPRGKTLRVPAFTFPSVGALAEIQRVRRWPFFSGMEIAARRGSLHSCRLKDDGIAREAWAITDTARRCVQARRLDGLPWTWCNAKAWTLGGSVASWPIGSADIGPRQLVAFCEGSPDFLAAHALAWLADLSEAVAVVTMPGASAAIHADALSNFTGKRVRIFQHADKDGERAGEKWARQLVQAGATVDGFTFDAPHKDLADVLAATDAEFVVPPSDVFEGMKGGAPCQ